MRVVKSIAHPAYKVDIFIKSNRYVLQVETSYFTQHYKFPQGHFESPEHLASHLDQAFWKDVAAIFAQMRDTARTFENPGPKNNNREII